MKSRNTFPERDPKDRVKDFASVINEFSFELAKAEADRCLQCPTKPCVSGCPVNINIPKFIKFLRDGDIKSSYLTIREDNFLPSVCGRVCPQERQCEAKCVLGKNSIAIGKLEMFVGDNALKNGWHEEINEIKINNKNNLKVAVIGSGPASLACAGEVARAGIEVDVFEALHRFGGVLVYGIPAFRLPKDVIEKEIKALEKMDVKFHKNILIGRTISFDYLIENYNAIFIGSGAGFPKFLNIPGESYKGVFSANEFLTRVNLMNAYDESYDTPIVKGKKAIIIGGGNTAVDAARTCLRLGYKDVFIVYRREEKDLPAREEEIKHAKEEGVQFSFLLDPAVIIGNNDGWVTGIEFNIMKINGKNDNGKSIIEKTGKTTFIDADTVIIAIGTTSNPVLRSVNGLEFNERGYIRVDKNYQTSIKNVFAGGDIVTGSATVIEALGAGKIAGKNIVKLLSL
ncbi:MAG TPA: NADPH-dependent glutamate synthase [Spirochaetota bacterium]|nr:NADPH-dependent glutamate synthase [Spirochaetota bacterium]HOM37748.1 NADPH-dependent glutamate synthase [Spirochaetota bacterium]HPQ49375.1 NADPH-dependent glutamate synthase [Spirochaetota bacterium]